jgi:hypothetical protein
MRRAAAVCAMLIALCGCSSSSSKSPSTHGVSATAAPPQSLAQESTVPGDGSVATTVAAATSSAGSSSADDTAAITAAFTTFFDGANPDVDAKTAVLEHGDQLHQMIVDATANAQFQQLSTKVNSVTLLSDSDCTAAGEVSPCASVSHDMFVGGLPAMVGLTSHAVKVGATWKVSAKSWCAIVQIGGAECPTLPAG